MIGNRRFVTLIILMVVTGVYINVHSDFKVPLNRPFSAFPAAHAGWRMTGESFFSAGVLDVLKPTDYLYRQYVDEAGRRVVLYVGYHSGGKGSGAIHSPKHCLPGSGWFEASSEKGSVEVGDGDINVIRAVYQKGDARELFVYWFQVRDRTLSNEYSLKLAEITGSFFHRRRDTAFVRISVPYREDGGQAVETAERFIRDFYPVITEYLPR